MTEEKNTVSVGGDYGSSSSLAPSVDKGSSPPTETAELERKNLPTIQSLVANLVDESNARGVPVLERAKGRWAGEIKRVLAAGVPASAIASAIERMVATAAPPSELASYAHTAQLRVAAEDERRANAAFRDFIDRYGWPTGATFVRGTHSGSFVYDPLGTDRLPAGYEGWPYAKPTRAEILLALKDAEL